MAIVCFFLLQEALASVHYTPTDLKHLGIDLRQFKIGTFSEDNLTFLSLEKTNSLELRSKGLSWILRGFKFSSPLRLVRVTSILLPLAEIDNLAITSDGQTAVLTSQYGTRVIAIDLQTRRLTTVFIREANKAGFRTSQLLWYSNGIFYSDGYFYDSDGYYIGDAVVKLNLKSPFQPEFFQKTWDIGKTRKSLGKMVMEFLVSGTQGFLGAVPRNGKEIELFYCHDGHIKRVDSALSYGGFAASNHRILYPAIRRDGSRELLIKDFQSSETWKLDAEKPYAGKPFFYPYLSPSNGQTAVVTLLDPKKATTSFYYAKQEQNFKLRPLKELQNVPVGIFRLSPDGNYYAYQNREGLTFGAIP